MHILVLTQIIPYPPDAGPKVKTWHVLRYLLGRGHRVSLVSFVRPEEEQYIPVLREQGLTVYPIPIRRSRVKDVGYFLRSLVSGRPFLIERDDYAEFRETVRNLAENNRVDVIHADQLTMAQFATLDGRSRQPARIFDAHNAVWTIVDRMAQNARWFLRPAAKIETIRVRQYEADIVSTFEHTLAVSEPDKTALLRGIKSPGVVESAKQRITVIPIAVDTEILQPLQRQAASRKIVTLGTLHYPPNADGIRWFMNEVFPLVLEKEPTAHLTIIGKKPPADFVERAQSDPDHYRVTGYVEQLDPYLSEAAIMVVPVRAGGGMRVRILEAFARGMPVVTTTIGLEGIDAQDGKEVIVRDDPDEFARAVVDLLQNLALQDSLAIQGRRLAEEKYDWQVALNTMDRVYRQIENTLEKGGHEGV